MINNNELDKQGHRGSRGTHPENTLEGMKFALENDVNTLEMDVVITSDKRVILSHEPWFNSEICLDNSGNKIPQEKEKEFNIYNLTYEEIKQFNCGSLNHPRFPNQRLKITHKPLLSDIIIQSDLYARQLGRPAPFYNIEIKYRKEYTNIYHPEYDEFSNLVYEVIKNTGIAERTTLQSFDISVLQYCRNSFPKVKISFLTENDLSLEQNLNNLGFKPDIYSCYYKNVTPDLVKNCHQLDINVIPWTINDLEEIKALIEMGVDGIITDFPQLFKKL